jgi:hypothetical protein
MRNYLAVLIVSVASVAHGLPAPPADDAQIVGPGHTAHWYVPEGSGAGWTLEVHDDESALVYWFTYDESGNQRWLIGTGEIQRNSEGEWIEFPELYVTSGGKFGTAFDPDDVEMELVGQAKMWFADCLQGKFYYDAFGQEQTLPIERLTRTMGAECRSAIHGYPLEPITEDAGLSGSWFNPSEAGHGFSMQWMSRDEALIIWYTYDRDGNQKWLIGVGSRDDEQIVFPEMAVTSGARFGEAFDPQDVEQQPWGMLALELDCSTGVIAWEATESGYDTGTLELERLTGLTRPACPVQRPRLSDLYEFEITEVPVPIPDGTPGQPQIHYHAEAMAEDGTVAGYDNAGRGWIWQPGESSIEQLDGEIISGNTMLWLEETNELVAMRREEDSVGSLVGVIPVRWVPSEGWEDLPGFNLDSSILSGSSNSGRYLTGAGREEERSWIWDSDNGQRLLPLSPSEYPNLNGRGEAVSNDGRIVAGMQVDFPGNGNFPRERATRWVDEEPELLRDQFGAVLRWAFACDDECSVILGGDQGAEVPTDHPHAGQAWLWNEDHGAIYFGELPHSNDWPNFAQFASHDGSLAIGTYQRARSSGASGQVRTFVWTPGTGIVSMTDVLSELEMSPSRWDQVRPVGVSADGRRMAIRTSEAGTNPAVHREWRAWVIELAPRRQSHE